MSRIRDFIALAKGFGFQKQSKYQVLIYPQASGSNAGVEDVLLMDLLCDNVTVPGMNFSTNPVFTFGEPREVVYNRNFDAANLQFLADSKMRAREYFDEWQTSVMNPTTRTVSYYNNYIRNVEIRHQDLEGNTQYTVTLFEAFPKAVSPYEMGNDNNTVLRVNVQLQFKYYTYNSNFIQAVRVNPRDRLAAITREVPQ